MNNEPVAWMMKSNDPDYVSDYIMFKTPERKDKISHHAIPLYTHPVKDDEGKVCARCGAIAYDPVIKQTSKELTADEIHEVAKQFLKSYDLECNQGFYGDTSSVLVAVEDWYDFARAILRKAQEK